MRTAQLSLISRLSPDLIMRDEYEFDYSKAKPNRFAERYLAMMVQNKEQVFQRLAEHRSQFGQYGVRRFGLFGSFVRGEQSRGSDVDILVEFESGKKTFVNFMHLAFFLEEVLGRKVDLLTPESLSPFIGPRILREVEYAPTDI